MRPALGAGSSLYEWRNPDGASRIANGNFGKRCATYPANLCPFRGGGAASSSRPRRTILPNESGNSKRFCDNRLPASGTPAKWGFSGHSQVRQLERKEELKAYPPGDGRFVKRRTSVKDWPVFCDRSLPGLTITHIQSASARPSRIRRGSRSKPSAGSCPHSIFPAKVATATIRIAGAVETKVRVFVPGLKQGRNRCLHLRRPVQRSKLPQREPLK